MAKYEITDMTGKVVDPTTKETHVLHRIRALCTFKTSDGSEVVEGQLGGLIEKPENLAQGGRCWINFEAMAYGDSEVMDDALICGKYCSVRDHAMVGGQAVVCSSELFGNTVVDGKARVFNGCSLSGNSHITDEARLDFGVYVFGNASIEGAAHCTNGTVVEGSATVCYHALVQGGHITGFTTVSGTANVRNTDVSEYAVVSGDTFVDSCSIANRCRVSGTTVMALRFKATEGLYADGVHCGRKGLNSLLLKLATKLKNYEKVYRFLMGQIRGLSRNELVVPSYPARSAVPSNG